jgi:heat shock protein HslJ
MKIIRIFAALVMIVVVCLSVACSDVSSPIEDYKWSLTSYTTGGQNMGILPDTTVTVQFDSKTGEVSGNGGCNSYFGNYEIDGLNLNIVGPFAVTEMWCGDEIGEQETTYLQALQSAESFQLDHGDLIIDCGATLLYFTRQ